MLRDDLAIPVMMQAMFEVLNPPERTETLAMFASDYGSGPIVIDVLELAEAAYAALAEASNQFI